MIEPIISDHAVERYRERFGGRSDEQIKSRLRKRFARAVPYGAQFGHDRMLMDDDAVLVVRRNRKGRQVVVTVLTVDQATANMEVIFA